MGTGIAVIFDECRGGHQGEGAGTEPDGGKFDLPASVQKIFREMMPCFAGHANSVIQKITGFLLETGHFRVELFFQIVSRGRGARTPIYGFGDRCSTIELFPYVVLFVCFIAEPRL